MDVIDPSCERLRPLAEYARRLPSRKPGKRLNRATLWRWALRGARAGRRLRTVALGGGRMTCDAWVWQFLEQPHSETAAGPTWFRLSSHERQRIERELRHGKDARVCASRSRVNRGYPAGDLRSRSAEETPKPASSPSTKASEHGQV